MFLFRKIWRALCSCNNRFQIPLFSSLPTISETPVMVATITGNSMVKFLWSYKLFSIKNAFNIMKYAGSTMDDGWLCKICCMEETWCYNHVRMIWSRELTHTARKNTQIRSFFWSVFSCIWTKYRGSRSKSPYSVRIRENTDQNKFRICTLFTQWQYPKVRE